MQQYPRLEPTDTQQGRCLVAPASGLSVRHQNRKFVPPVAAKEVALLDGSGQVRAAGGAPCGPVLQPPAASVLFARADSCYKDLVADVWDIQRDARLYRGDNPVVCHPPCRGWGRLRHWAKPRPDEKALAIFAVEQIRRVGGVLEHPWGSTLWHEKSLALPYPGHVDQWGGFTLLVDQGWWGHKAPKPTYVYVAGCHKKDVPSLPVQLERAKGRTLDLSPADREHTPVEFAKFLLHVASICKSPLLQPPALMAVTPDLVDCNNDLVQLAVTVSWRKRRASYIDLVDVLIGDEA